MAGNDWINSYLEAILDVGPGIDDAKSSLLLRERGRFSPTRYFVEQVIGFDETDLYRSWVKAAATRSPQERNTRLENMCWRIWNLARQKKQLEGEEAQRMAKRRLERERGRREATADMSEDLSEGEKGDTVSDLSAHGESNRGRLPRISSVETMEAWVMPPGMEFHHIVPHEGDMDGETEGNEDQPTSPDPPIWPEVPIISLHFL
ncbi:sucrose phosphate synthase 1F [Actinidia rufa]|uniref:Sucrose phosphate synthase 1F n=1 Tax=Actinidia rufa TaxID=165716 RepID=A0A7J0FLV2_9ERIC|nr:sucrose phosphate synthase 1F [Actinidia rufa]